MSMPPPTPAGKGYWGFVGTDGNVEETLPYFTAKEKS